MKLNRIYRLEASKTEITAHQVDDVSGKEKLDEPGWGSMTMAMKNELELYMGWKHRRMR